MSEDINIQKLSYLTCPVHQKRVQFLCAVEKCGKSLICGECLVTDKFHVNEHLDGFCSTDDYKSKIIFGVFQKFEECITKLENQETTIANNIAEISEDFTQQINQIQTRVFAVLADHFSALKERIRGLVELKFANYLSSLGEMKEEVRLTREHSHEFLAKLKSVLDQDKVVLPDIETQIRLFNNKKYFDRALVGRIDTLLTYLAEQARVTPNLEVTKSVFKLEDSKLAAVGNGIVVAVKKALEKGLESQEILEGLQAKPVFAVSRVREQFLRLNDNADFQRLSKLSRINSFELSPHSSVKLNCMVMVDQKYLLTCFNDRVYKVWWINPQRFNSGLKNAIKVETPFVPIYSSEPELHAHFISAAEYIPLSDNRYRLVTADKSGQVRVVDFEFLADKVTSRTFLKGFSGSENKVTELLHISNADILAVGDRQFGVSFFCTKTWTLKTRVEAPESGKLVGLTFANLFSYLSGINERGTLFSWRMEFADTASTQQIKNNAMFEGNSLELRRASNHLKLVFNKGPFNAKLFNVFSTNHKGDNLVFVSDGAVFRVITLYNGETVTSIDGTHYKGISNLFFVVNASTESQLFRLLNIIENEYLHKTSKEVQDNRDQMQAHYKDLLNCYKLVTVSNREFVRLWAIQNLEPRLLDQDEHPGGSYGKFLFKFQNKRGENFLVTAGKNSNKVIIYQLM
jgi:WD40 repeat protein